jgi:ActR/RegA family two-component response regulator
MFRSFKLSNKTGVNICESFPRDRGGCGDARRTRSPTPLRAQPDEVQWEHIQFVLKMSDDNITRAAAKLNLHRRSLQRMLSKRAPAQ